MRTKRPPKSSNSLKVKSIGNDFEKKTDDPNRTLVHVRKKKVGPNKYSKTIRIRHKRGKRSKKKPKNKTSVINMIDPGKPKNTNKLIKLIKNNFGHRKFIPLISVTNLVLKRRPIASTSKKELVDKSA